jgi:hypothetical protein
VDIVAEVTEAGLRDLVSALDDTEFYVPASEAAAAVTNGDWFNVIHLPSGGKVDLFVAPPGDPFTQSRLARRVRGSVLGIDAWVASAEDVLLAKLRWRLESRSEVQWRDCAEIAASNQLDRAYLATWAPVLGVTDDLAALLREVDDARGS